MTELGLPFEETLMAFDDGDSWAKFRTFSPTGLVPCLHDGAQVVWESLAITEYLAERHPEVWPADRAARAWARSAAAEMHAGFSALRNECPMSVGMRIRLPAISAALQKNLERLQELWQQGLAQFGGPYLAGSRFTAVDAFFAPVAFRVQTFALPLDADASAYVERLLALPGMQRWTVDALAETFREPSHEDELAALGEITADLRASPA